MAKIAGPVDPLPSRRRVKRLDTSCLPEGFAPVDTKAVLEKVAALPITRWYYTHDLASPHLGPMAQDFYPAFNLGVDDKHIATVDEGGVVLAAIQGLNQRLNEDLKAKDAEIQTLKRQNASFADRLQTLEQAVNCSVRK